MNKISSVLALCRFGYYIPETRDDCWTELFSIVKDDFWDCKWILCGELWQKGHYLPIFKIISDYNSNKRLFIVSFHHLHAHAKSVSKIYGNYCLAERSFTGQRTRVISVWNVLSFSVWDSRLENVEKLLTEVYF